MASELVSVVRRPALREAQEHPEQHEVRLEVFLRRKYSLPELPGVEVERLVWEQRRIKGKI